MRKPKQVNPNTAPPHEFIKYVDELETYVNKLEEQLRLYSVVFNEADLVSSDSINDAPEPLWKSHDLEVEDSEVELCGRCNGIGQVMNDNGTKMVNCRYCT